MPDVIRCYNNVSIHKVEALCMTLQRYSYPCRHLDMMSNFGRTIPQSSIVVTHVTNFLHTRWGHLLTNLNQNWLSPASLENFAEAIQRRGAGIDNCWNFVDGTVRACCRPGRNQRVLYNGHKKVHAIKFQSVVTPDGMIANMFGPVEGRRHDSAMLAMSNLLPQLQQNSIDTNGNLMCIYGDPAYPVRAQLLSPFPLAHITPAESAWNQSMSSVRVAVEWVFGDIINYFKFIDFRNNLKIGLSPIGKMYLVCALLKNARTTLYGNLTGMTFDVDSPVITDYFV